MTLTAFHTRYLPCVDWDLPLSRPEALLLPLHELFLTCGPESNLVVVQMFPKHMLQV